MGVQAGAVATKGALGDACAAGHRERSGMADGGARVPEALSLVILHYAFERISRDTEGRSGSDGGSRYARYRPASLRGRRTADICGMPFPDNVPSPSSLPPPTTAIPCLVLHIMPVLHATFLSRACIYLPVLLLSTRFIVPAPGLYH